MWKLLPSDIVRMVCEAVLEQAPPRTPKEFLRRTFLLLSVGKSAIPHVVVYECVRRAFRACSPKDFDIDIMLCTAPRDNELRRVRALATLLRRHRLAVCDAKRTKGVECALISMVTLGAAPPEVVYKLVERAAPSLEENSLAWLSQIPPDLCVWCGDLLVHAVARHGKTAPPGIPVELFALGDDAHTETLLGWFSATFRGAQFKIVVDDDGAVVDVFWPSMPRPVVVNVKPGPGDAGASFPQRFPFSHQRAYATVPAMTVFATRWATDAWGGRKTVVQGFETVTYDEWVRARALGFDIGGDPNPLSVPRFDTSRSSGAERVEWTRASTAMPHVTRAQLAALPEGNDSSVWRARAKGLAAFGVADVEGAVRGAVVCRTYAHWRAALQSGAVHAAKAVVVVLRPYMVTAWRLEVRHTNPKGAFACIELQVPHGEKANELRALASATSTQLGCEFPAHPVGNGRSHDTFKVAIASRCDWPAMFDCDEIPVNVWLPYGAGTPAAMMAAAGGVMKETASGMAVVTLLLTRAEVAPTEEQRRRAKRENVFALDAVATGLRVNMASRVLMC